MKRIILILLCLSYIKDFAIANDVYRPHSSETKLLIICMESDGSTKKYSADAVKNIAEGGIILLDHDSEAQALIGFKRVDLECEIKSALWKKTTVSSIR
jgi:hypothetical protein